MRHYRNFVGNAWRPDTAAPPIEVWNPATQQPIATTTAATTDGVTTAVELAARAQAAWRRLPSIERGRALHRLADALLSHIEAIGTALAQESGKSLEDARDEVRYGAEIVRYHAEWARRIEGEIVPSDTPRERLYLHREPLGVVACLIPFNFPVYTLLRKVAPALITGNTVVVRPSNTTPGSAFEIARAVLDAGLPPGVVNIMTMDHATCAVMCTQPAVAMVTLTGSLEAGRQVMEYAKTNIARLSLELGGKTPAIVAADADLDRAAADIVRSRLTHCGQLCTSVERVLVDRRVHDPLLERLQAHMARWRWGDRREQPDRMGPLANAQARARVHGMVRQALEEGARLALGGQVPDGPGFFYPPTLLESCRHDMTVMREEVFGPVLPVMACDDLDHALACANDHQYGLSSVLYTESHRVAQRFASEIEAGELYVNRTPADPYQGHHAGWKRSGVGGDDGKHGMLAFTQTRLAVMAY